MSIVRSLFLSDMDSKLGSPTCKKRIEKTTLFCVKLMRSPVLYRAAPTCNIMTHNDMCAWLVMLSVTLCLSNGCHLAGCSSTPTSVGTTHHIRPYHMTQPATAMTMHVTLQLLTLTWPAYICTQQWRPTGLNFCSSRSVMLDGLVTMHMLCNQVMYEPVALSVAVIEGLLLCYSLQRHVGYSIAELTSCMLRQLLGCCHVRNALHDLARDLLRKRYMPVSAVNTT